MSDYIETAVLNACICEPEADELFALKPSDFSQALAPVYEALQSMYLAGEPRDYYTVAVKLSEQEQPELIEWVKTALDSTPYSRAAFPSYIAKMRDRSLRNRISSIANQMQRWCSEQSGEEAFQKALSALSEIDVQQEDSVKGMREVLTHYLADLERRFDSTEEIDGLGTGIKCLDTRYGGLKPSWLVIIAGRPSMGKSTLGLNIVEHNALNGVPSLVFSLEMTPDEIAPKFLASKGGIPSNRLKDASLVEGDWPRLTTATGIFKDAPIFIDDRGTLSVADIRSKAFQVKRKFPNLGLIMVDYLQLMSGEGDNRESIVSGITRQLKNLAKDLNIPIIAISQLNRELEKRGNKRPIPSDLRESGAIEQDANIILFVYRDEVYDEFSQAKGVAELITAKFRGGEIGTDYVAARLSHSRFDNLAHNYVPPDPAQRKGRKGFEL